MAITVAAAAYQVRIAAAGATSMGTPDLTLAVSDLAGVPILSGPSVDVLKATTVSHPFKVECIVDTPLFLSSGRLTELGRLIDVQRADDGGAYATLATGRISHVSEIERGKVVIEVSDERWVERRSEIFRTTDTVQLHPPGLATAWHGRQAAGTSEYRVMEISGDAVRIGFVPDESQQGGPVDYDASVPESLTRALAKDLKRVLTMTAANSAGNFEALRFEYSGADRTVISFRENLTAGFIDPTAPTGPLGTMSPGGGGGRLNFAWVYIASHGLSVGNTITGRFYFPAGIAVSENIPLHIGGLNGVHPMTLLKAILDGDYGGQAENYDSAAMTTLQALSMRPVWARIPASANRAKWLEKNLYPVYLVVPMVGTDLALRPTSLRAPIDEDPDTYTELDATNASLPTWSHTSADLVTVVAFRSRYVTPMNDTVDRTFEWPVDELRLETFEPPDIEHDNVGTLGEVVHEVDTDLIISRSFPYPDEQVALASELFNVFGNGPQSGELRVPDDAGVQVGEHVSLNHDSFKGFNPGTGARSGSRVVQLVGFSEQRPDSTVFQYLDRGPHSQPLSAPTVSIAQAAALDYVEVTISGLAADTTAIVEVETGTVAPTTFGLIRADVGNETVSFFLASASGNAYARARAVAPGRISSAWASDSVALTSRPRIDFAEILRTGTTARVNWEVSSTTLGMRTDYDIHARGESPTFGSNQADYDVDDGGFDIAGLISTRDVASVLLTPYTGWTGSAVSGTAGDPRELTALFPRIALPGGVVLYRARASVEASFDANGETVVSAAGDGDTVALYVTVGDGTDPADPTVATNDGVINGGSGSVATGVKITTGNDAHVKVVAANSSGSLGPVVSARQARRLGPFAKDTSATATSGATETTLVTHTVPAGRLGTDGAIRVTAVFFASGTAGSKSINVKWGGTTLVAHTPASNAAGFFWLELLLFNVGSASVQELASKFISDDYQDVDYNGDTVDTTSAVDLVLTGQCSDAGDSITLQVSHAVYLGTE